MADRGRQTERLAGPGRLETVTADWADLTSAGQRHAIFTLLQTINGKVDQLMSDQSHLEADATAIEAAEQSQAASDTAIQAAVAALKAAAPASLDFTDLDKALADDQAQAAAAAADAAADVPAPAPAPVPDPTPAPDPTPPAS